MRNREAARYARRSAIAAALIALAVAGVYLERAARQRRSYRGASVLVSPMIQQRSNEFSFSKVEQDRTLFTIRASHATQFKDQDRALLEDVWITIYGRQGDRNDNIHTRQCSYEPVTGAIRCEGDVQIDIQGSNPASGQLADKAFEIKTRNLTFNRETGEASTPEPVEFRSASGEGHGAGVLYSSRDGIIRVLHSVEFNLVAPSGTGNPPISGAGSSVEIRRNDRTVLLDGPAVVRQGNRQITADKITVALDENYRAQHAIAEGHSKIRTNEAMGSSTVSAGRFEASVNPAGWVERIVGDGNIAGIRQSVRETDRFLAAHVDLMMLPEHNLVRQMTASGGVTAEIQQGGDSRVLKTDALKLDFSPGVPPRTLPHSSTSRQQIQSVETLAPASIESKSAGEVTFLHARKFVAQLGSGGLEKLFGHSGVDLRRQVGNGSPQTSSAEELVATFAANGNWETLDEAGNVHFQQDDRQGSAAHARMIRSTGLVTLDGSPVLSDSMSRTTAGSVTLNQSSGELHAGEGVVSTYLPDARGDAVGLGSGPTHISADSLSGSTSSGHANYSGHARLWQGDSVLGSDQIELWREDKKLQATGHVVAIFQQEAAPTMAAGPPKEPSKATPQGPTLWHIRAPLLTYWSDQGKALLEQGVVAVSDQGSLESRTLEVFLANQEPGQAISAPSRNRAPSGSPAPANRDRSQQLSKVLAHGNVVVRQGDRKGTGEQAEFTAADGKFVLSGGQPTLTNTSTDTTTGHSLTFFVANDTILVDSQGGSRTLTKHRVEK